MRRLEFSSLKLLSALLTFLLLACANQLLAQSFYIVSLGLTDGTDLTAVGMNNKGEVAGYYNRVSDNYFSGGWLWLPAADFGYPSGHSFIPPTTSGDNAQLQFSGINNFGVAAGTMNDFNDGGEGEVNQHLITWEGGNISVELTGRPDTNDVGLFNPSARQINDLGRFIANVDVCTGGLNCTNGLILTPVLAGAGQSFDLLASAGKVLDINNRGESVGFYGQDGAYRGCVWYGTRQVDFNFGSTNLFPERINDNGEILGVTALSGKARVFLYLPAPAYSLPAGVNYLMTNGVTNATALGINNRGQALFIGAVVATNGTFPGLETKLFRNGGSLGLNAFLSSKTPWTNGLTAVDINDNGWIVGNGLAPDLQVEPFLMRPLIDLAVTTSTNHVKINDQFTVTLKVTSHLSNDLLKVAPIITPLRVEGSGTATIVSGPTPATQTLTTLSNCVFTYTVKAATAGFVRFTSEVRGSTTVNGQVTSLPMTSDAVRINDSGDLLVKAGWEPETAYKDAGVFYSVPGGGQLRNIDISPGNPVSLNVRAVNTSGTNRSYAVNLTEVTNAGWQINYFDDASNNITAALRAGTYTTPVLATNAFETLTVNLLTTNTGSATNWSAEFALLSDTNSYQALDTASLSANYGAIVVNTTGDEADADPNDGVPDVDLTKPGLQVTLRAALEFANAHPGNSTIKFEIPPDDPGIDNGIPIITPKSALPAITNTITIDGWSQNPGANNPPVEIDGDYSSLGGDTQVSGFTVNANNCSFSGLAIVGFPNYGIIFNGSHNTVQGCFLGASADGSESQLNGTPLVLYHLQDPNPLFGGGMLIRSDHNQIGGSAVKQGNVFLGNCISVSRAGSSDLNSKYLFTQPGDGHFICAAPAGLTISGSAATQNTVEGNLFGSVTSLANPSTSSYRLPTLIPPEWFLLPWSGILVTNAPGNFIGGAGAGDGNVIEGSILGIELTGDGCVGNFVIGNQLGPLSTQERQYYSGAGETIIDAVGIDVDSASDNFIGGLSSGAANVIFDRNGVNIAGSSSGNIVSGNFIGQTATGLPAAGTFATGIFLPGGTRTQIISNTISGLRDNAVFVQSSSQNLITGNRISLIGSDAYGDGVCVLQGTGNAIVSNSISQCANLAIHLSTGSINFGPPLPNDFGDPDDGPNMLQNHPTINVATNIGTSLHIQGSLSTVSGAKTYHIEFYASHGQPQGFPQGEIFLGAINSATGVGGEDTFTADLTLASPLAAGLFLTATDTDPDGNTSEFSSPFPIGGGTDTDADGIPDQLENLVPSRKGTGTGDGNGDGTQDSQQTKVASLPSITGQYETLVTITPAKFLQVLPLYSPEAVPLPAGYSFPLGLLQYTVTNLTSGGTTVTNFFPDGYTFNTWWNYGGTPDQTAPHWYQFTFDGTTGTQIFSNRAVLHLKDDMRGDGDLTVNNAIHVLGGPATVLPTGPSLAIQFIGSTNVGPVSTYSFKISWPAAVTNVLLEMSPALSPPDASWQDLGAPFVVGSQNVITNITTGGQLFYRLRPL